MNPARTRTIALSALLAVVLMGAAPVLAGPTRTVAALEKAGASGQRYAWAPGGC